MKIDQENGMRARSYAVPLRRAIARDVIAQNFDLLRERVWERSIWAARRQRVQEVIVTVMAIVLGCIMGWSLVR